MAFSRPPVVDGRREACLAPPFAPATDSSTEPDGTQLSRVDARTWSLAIAGDRELTTDESMALLDRLRLEDAALRFLGFGIYCGTPAHMCFQIAASLCETHVDELVNTFRTALGRDGQLAGARIELRVVLEGRLGPRCASGDPTCLPVPYEGEPHFDPGRPRHAGRLVDHSLGACRDDGECVVGGCGNDCTLWELGGANESATCEGYAFSDPAPMFCGCVDGGCSWFTQD